MLGEISFSIYLLHGAVLYVLFTQLELLDFRHTALDQFSLLMPLVCVLVVFMFAIAYLLIERPFMQVGRRFIISYFVNRVLSRLTSKVRMYVTPIFYRWF